MAHVGTAGFIMVLSHYYTNLIIINNYQGVKKCIKILILLYNMTLLHNVIHSMMYKIYGYAKDNYHKLLKGVPIGHRLHQLCPHTMVHNTHLMIISQSLRLSFSVVATSSPISGLKRK